MGLNSLQRELVLIAAAGVALLLIEVFSLNAVIGFRFTAQAFLQSLLLWGLLWHQCWQRRARNRASADSPLLTSLGWANRLTLARGWLIAMCAGLLFQPAATAGTAWLPAIGYSLAAIADRFDGYVARRTRNTTVLGSELDMSFDAIGLVIAPLLAVSYGKLHPLYLLVSVAYYFFVAGIYWRRRHGKPVLPLRKSELRRTLAGMQMGFVAFVLWPPLQPTLTIVAGIAFMLPLLAGFWIDWLVVSARLPAHTKEAEQQFQQRKEFSHQWLQPALRVVLLASLALAEWQQRGNVPLTLLLIAVCLLILLGIAGRTLAVLLLLLLNWTPGVDFTSTIGVLIVFSAVWILVLGTGRFTLWQRDADWITQQGGA